MFVYVTSNESFSEKTLNLFESIITVSRVFEILNINQEKFFKSQSKLSWYFISSYDRLIENERYFVDNHW